MDDAASDPLDHPDIHVLGAHLDRQLGEILAAEQHAARVAAQRRMTLRDHLVRCEDALRTVTVSTSEGPITGAITAVGRDHVVIDDRHVIAISHVVGVEVHR